MYEFDAALTAWINAYAGRFPAFDAVVIAFSVIGVPILVATVTLQWWVPYSDRHIRHVVVAAGLSFLLGLGFNQVILLFVQRIRPYDAHVTHLVTSRSGDFSFPSDHATAGFAIAVAFLLHGLRGRGLVFLAAAVLLALSRVYVGTHYVSDVLGGGMTGLFAAAVIRIAYREGSKLDRFATGIL